jgi:uncharacterized protein (TIGR03083 family)
VGLSRSKIWAFVHGERRTLAAVLATLSAEEWAAESLCSGWTVKDVAAHVIAHPEVRLRTAVPGLIQARGNYAEFVYNQGKRVSNRLTDEIVADFTRLDGSKGRPTGTPVRFALIEILVHTQDIVVPLGKVHAMPPIAAACAADLVRRIAASMGVNRRFPGFVWLPPMSNGPPARDHSSRARFSSCYSRRREGVPTWRSSPVQDSRRWVEIDSTERHQSPPQVAASRLRRCTSLDDVSVVRTF